MFKKLAAAAVATILASTASAAVIDFDALDGSATQTLLTSFSEDGFTFDVRFRPRGDPEATGVAVFDTTCTGAACNGDTDLVPASQGLDGVGGNILILQEANSNTPDDDGGGGRIFLTLTGGSAFRFVGASAIDDTRFRFGTIIDGNNSGPLARLDLEDGKTGSVSFTSDLVKTGDSIWLDLRGSGGFDSLQLAAVPLPAGGLLILTGLAGLGALKRRK